MDGNARILAAMVTPALLWGGLGLASIPIVIHLFSRRRFRRVRWAATAFLLEANRRNRRRLRIEQMILLALRCLAMVLAGLLLARPFARTGAWADLPGTTHRTDRLFVLDDSYSMGARLGAVAVFDRAREKLLEAVHLVHAQHPNDPVTVVLTSRPQAPLISGAHLDKARLEKLSEMLDGLAVSETADVGRAFEELANLLAESDGSGDAAVHIISDFQRKDWVGRGEGAGPHVSPLEAFKDRGDDAVNLALILIPVMPDERENLTIAALEPAQRRFVAGVTGRINVRITNHGSRAAENVVLRVIVDGAPLADKPGVGIEAGETVSIRIEVLVASAGSHLVRVELRADILELDNAHQLAFEAVRAVRLLIVNGEPASDATRDEAALLAAALNPGGPVSSGNEVRVVDEVEFGETDLSAFDAVILANVYRLDDQAVSRLERFAAEGGGVVFFPGDQVDPEAYNVAFHRGGEGILPVRLEGVIRAPANRPAPSLAVAEAHHPLTRFLAGVGNMHLARPHFQQYFRLVGVSQDAESVTSLDAPGEPGREDGRVRRSEARVLLNFTDAEANPALVEGSFGEGRVLVFASSCDREWNDWAQGPGYVVTALEMAQYVARPERSAGQVQVGSPIRIWLDPAEFEPSVMLRVPGAGPDRGIEIQAQADPNGDRMSVLWEQTERSGTYTFELTDRAGERREKFVAVHCDPREGDLGSASRDELARVCEEVSDEVAFGSPADEGSETLAGMREFWPVLVVVLATLLMIEQGLAWWFGRR